MNHPTILVGDIGSTKSTWRYSAEPSGVIRLRGYNPVSHEAREGHLLFEELCHATRPHTFSHIWYYGSGVLDDQTAGMVREGLALFFPATHLHVASDLTGAALAACGHEPGSIAILGTGSHAALFDGDQIVRQATSLGYILGDEGGGADIGKALLQAYFYQEMPDTIKPDMANRLPGGRAAFLKSLSLSPVPNQFLAEFAQIAVQHHDDPWIQTLVRDRFQIFVKKHIRPLNPTSPVHIIGSIGCIFAGLIREELEKAGYHAGSYLRDPVLRLFEIHMEHEKQQS